MGPLGSGLADASGDNVRLGPSFGNKAQDMTSARARAGEQRQVSLGEDGPRGLMEATCNAVPGNTWCASGRTHRMDVFPKCKLGANSAFEAPGGRKKAFCLYLCGHQLGRRSTREPP